MFRQEDNIGVIQPTLDKHLYLIQRSLRSCNQTKIKISIIILNNLLHTLLRQQIHLVCLTACKNPTENIQHNLIHSLV